jgi:hypothetical protein
MTRPFACAMALAWMLAARQTVAGGQTTAPLTADQLVARVIEVRNAERFQIRATLTRSTPGTDVSDTRQLTIKGQWDRGQAITLFQQLWPVVAGGRALVVEDKGDHQLKGFRLESGKVTPLTTALLGDRLFDSDLVIEDVAEGFWFWPSRTIAGEEAVGAYTCVIVDLRPGPRTPTSYSLVKTWLSPELSTGLRAEQYGRDGRLVKRVGLYRMLNVHDRWMPGIITVEPADGKSRTVIEGVKLEQDVPLSAADFTVDAVRRAGR